jgi:hypothetical protein
LGPSWGEELMELGIRRCWVGRSVDGDGRGGGRGVDSGYGPEDRKGDVRRCGRRTRKGAAGRDRRQRVRDRVRRTSI